MIVPRSIIAGATATANSLSITSTSTLMSRPSLFPTCTLTSRPFGGGTSARYLSTDSNAFSSTVSNLVASPLRAISPVAGFLSFLALVKYRASIQKRIRQVKEESWIFGAGLTMERSNVARTDTKKHAENDAGLFGNLRLLELNQDFKTRCEKEGWKLESLGSYMASLRPKNMPSRMNTEDLPRIIQQEIEAGLALGLLKGLGPNLGAALLPAVGAGPVRSAASGLAGKLATNWLLDPNSTMSESQDKAGFPISLMTLLSLSYVNAKINSKSANDDKKDTTDTTDEAFPFPNMSSMRKLEAGEIVKGPSFDEKLHVSNRSGAFVLSDDFDNAIRQMEIQLGFQEHDVQSSPELQIASEDLREYNDGSYHDRGEHDVTTNSEDVKDDPEDRSMGKPVPINPRLFPDLHLGWGDAKSSHTKREVLRMRLISTLLNRLGANYCRQMDGAKEDELFAVQMTPDNSPITRPDQFVQALIDSGHEVSIVPTSRLTTFGLGMCIAEKDGSWTNVPLGVFIESGYEDKNGRMAPAMMPHSGLNMYIKGPIAGNRADGTQSELSIQHFIGIEGFCGWKSHANPDVPFNEAIPMGPRLYNEDAVRGARLAALYAVTLNGLASDLGLPFGGYGVTAVCNDSAAIVQQCMYGTNTIYPMTSIGRFELKTMRYAKNIESRLEKLEGMDNEKGDVRAIIEAMKLIPSDINASPSNAKSAASRLLNTLQPKLPFLLMQDSKEVMESILVEEGESNGVVNSGSSQEKVVDLQN